MIYTRIGNIAHEHRKLFCLLGEDIFFDVDGKSSFAHGHNLSDLCASITSVESVERCPGKCENRDP